MKTDSESGFFKGTFLKQAAHPCVCILHFFFKSTALFWYSLLSYFFLSLFVGSMPALVTVQFLSALDFWVVQNITGRLLVGLRWRTVVTENGGERWVFESWPDEKEPNSVDKLAFWLGLLLSPTVWGVFFLANLLTFSLFWRRSEEYRSTNTVEAVKELDSVSKAGLEHAIWLESSLAQCPLPGLETQEGEAAVEQLALRLGLEEFKELIITLGTSLDLLETHNSGLHSEGLLAELLNEDIRAAFEAAKSQLNRLTAAFNRQFHIELLRNKKVALCSSLGFRRYDWKIGAKLITAAGFLYGASAYLTLIDAKDIAETIGTSAAVVQGIVPLSALIATFCYFFCPSERYKTSILVISLCGMFGNLLCLSAELFPSAFLFLSGRFLLGFSSPVVLRHHFTALCVPPASRAFWQFLSTASVLAGVLAAVPMGLERQGGCWIAAGGWAALGVAMSVRMEEPGQAFRRLEGLSALTPLETVNWSPSLVSSVLLISKLTQEAFLTSCPLLVSETFHRTHQTAASFLSVSLLLSLCYQCFAYSPLPKPGSLSVASILCFLGSLLLINVTASGDLYRFVPAALMVMVAGPLCEQNGFLYRAEEKRGKGKWLLIASSQGVGLTLGNALAFLALSSPPSNWSTLLFLPTTALSLALIVALLVRSLETPQPQQN